MITYLYRTLEKDEDICFVILPYYERILKVVIFYPLIIWVNNNIFKVGHTLY